MNYTKVPQTPDIIKVTFHFNLELKPGQQIFVQKSERQMNETSER
jgi:hypothetical protein